MNALEISKIRVGDFLRNPQKEERVTKIKIEEMLCGFRDTLWYPFDQVSGILINRIFLEELNFTKYKSDDNEEWWCCRSLLDVSIIHIKNSDYYICESDGSPDLLKVRFIHELQNYFENVHHVCLLRKVGSIKKTNTLYGKFLRINFYSKDKF